MKKSVIYLFILLVGVAFDATASSVSFKATVSKTAISLGERIQVTFTTNANLRSFTPPDFRGFQVLQGPMQSYRQQNVNGRISNVSSISYVIQAIEEGDLEIGVAKGDIGDEVLTTEPIQINVSQKNAEQERKEREAQQRKEANALFESMFILVDADKTSAFVGEKITVRYVLYTRQTLANLAVNKTPDLNGFWSKDIKSLYDSQLKQDVATFNGKQYTTLELKSSILYPQRSGELQIDPIEINAIYQVRTGQARSVFEQMFGGAIENKEVLLKSKPIKINVKPLSGSQPADFNGAVGSFTAEMTANKTEVKANEAINLKITIEGKGNLHLLPSPELPTQPDIEVYDPKVNDKFATNLSGISGSREFEYLIIPRHEGDFTIPAFTFSYFDLASKSYKQASTNPIQLKVLKGDGKEVVAYTPSNKEEIALLDNDIIHIKRSADGLTDENEHFFGSSLFYFLMILPFLLLGGGIWYKSKFDALNSNKVLLKKNKANKMATKRLASAKKHLSNNDLTSFYQEIGVAVLNYFSDKLSIPKADLSKEKILDQLNGTNVAKEDIQSVAKLIDDAEMARYAPSSDLKAEEMYQLSIELISKIENQIK